MPVDFAKARTFVHAQGTLFERALFDWLFEGGSLQRLRQILFCYKNPDNGFGHGFEHDLKAPQSNPLALEYLLGLMRYTGIPPASLLDGTAEWLESQMDAAGNLINPPAARDYPLAPWWQSAGGQTMPDSIVGNLIHFGAANPVLIKKTARWRISAPKASWKTTGSSWLTTLLISSSPSTSCPACSAIGRRQSRISSPAPKPRRRLKLIPFSASRPSRRRSSPRRCRRECSSAISMRWQAASKPMAAGLTSTISPSGSR